jgi:hypothetical protein
MIAWHNSRTEKPTGSPAAATAGNGSSSSSSSSNSGGISSGIITFARIAKNGSHDQERSMIMVVEIIIILCLVLGVLFTYLKNVCS